MKAFQSSVASPPSTMRIALLCCRKGCYKSACMVAVGCRAAMLALETPSVQKTSLCGVQCFVVWRAPCGNTQCLCGTSRHDRDTPALLEWFKIVKLGAVEHALRCCPLTPQQQCCKSVCCKFQKRYHVSNYCIDEPIGCRGTGSDNT